MPAAAIVSTFVASSRVIELATRRFINKLAPGSVKNVQTSTMPFKQMENIGSFQAGAKAYGCSDVEVFQTAVRPPLDPSLSIEPGRSA